MHWPGRRAELCGLRWSDLDDDGGGFTVRLTIVEVTRSQVQPGQTICPVCGQEHIGRLFKGPKSRAGRRWAPLAGPAQAALDLEGTKPEGDKVDHGEAPNRSARARIR